MNSLLRVVYKRSLNVYNSTKILSISQNRLFCNVSNLNTNILKDVILFKYENPRFFKIINIFAGCQFVFWSYLAVTSYKTLRDVPVKEDGLKLEGLPWWQRINLGETKYRTAITLFSFTVGYGILVVTWMYTLRSVRYLILRQGGKYVTIITYAPFGKNRMFTTPLSNINCKEGRTTAKSQLPIKVKAHRLHYILDMRGEFKNAALFDQTAGVKRKWRIVE